MLRISLWFVIVLALATGACADADPPGPDPVEEPTDSEERADKADAPADAGIDEADMPTEVKEDPVIYTRIKGDVLTRDTCEAICRTHDLFCGDEHHSFRGSGGGVAWWNELYEVMLCRDRPRETKVDFAGNVWELTEYTCYCRPPLN